MTRKNPSDLIVASVAPLLPYALLGVVIYFWGGKIATAIGSKISGVPAEQYKKDIATIKTASSGDILKGVTGILTFGLYDPSGGDYITQTKAITDILTLAIQKGWITQAELPYPTATSLDQLTKNKEYLNEKRLKALKGK